MAVVVKNATKGIIFGYDGNNDKWRVLNLETHFKSKPFDIKVLDNKGVDIVASGTPFISDIDFNDNIEKEKLSLDYYRSDEHLKKYLELLANVLTNENEMRYVSKRRKKITTVDYYNPINWALTFKMRGFDDVHSAEYPTDHPMMHSYTASGVLYALKKLSQGERIKNIKPTMAVDTIHKEMITKHLKEIDKYSTKMCIYVEYESTIPTDMDIKERLLFPEVPTRSKVLDFFTDESIYGTMIGISMSPSLTDFLLHSDEGWYEACVNYYNKNQGIVLLGEQNSNVMYYGNAVYEEIFIPDVLYHFQ